MPAMTNKDKYRQFCEAHPVPLYLRDWWLDAVCGEKWEVIASEGKSPVFFAFPYKKKYGLRLISMPLLTLGLGPVGKDGLTSFSEELMSQLPPFDLLDLFLLSGVDAEVKGWKVQTRYTYRVNDLGNAEKLFASFASSTRQQIRKAEKRVKVVESEDAELLYRMVSLTFRRQSKKAPYTLPFVKAIVGACALRGCGRILVAKDQLGEVHGACFVAWDDTTAYYVMGGADPKLRSSAAYSLLMWEAIKVAGLHAKIFDFCGSSIPSIARFFEGYAAKRVAYLHIKKVNSKALKLALVLQGK